MNHDLDALSRCKRCGFDAIASHVITACTGDAHETKPKVVPMRNAPPLTDIAGRLENFAEKIRTGSVAVTNVTLVVSDADNAVSVYDFGAHISPQHTIGVLQCAQQIVIEAVPFRGKVLPDKPRGSA